VTAAAERATDSAKIFDVGINERLPTSQLLVVGLQNVFGMTGMFVFPGILGRAFHLSPDQIAYLYGMTFMVCGLTTVFQSVVLLRLPITQGPYAGCFAALLAVGHLAGGLGAAYGSLLVAGLIWCLLTISIKGFSVIGLFARFMRAPIISGMIVVLIMVQIANVAFPNWIGQRQSPGFPLINLFAGGICLIAVIAVTLWGGALRRGAILIGLALGTACYAAFRPISLGAIAGAPWLVTPKLFPFGVTVDPELVLVFLLVLIPAGIGSMALYQIVADWGREPLSAERMAQGTFAMGVGAVLAGLVGGFSTIVYPDNMGLLRTTRVGSRFGTAAAGILLIVLGACVKFDMLLVLVPLPVVSAAATLLFGVVFMHGVHMLSGVAWDDRKLMVAGLAMLIGLGGLFISPDVMGTMPVLVRLLVQQPVISGGVTLVVLYALLCAEPAPAKAAAVEAPAPNANR
jgi:xanthine/uracil permease